MFVTLAIGFDADGLPLIPTAGLDAMPAACQGRPEGQPCTRWAIVWRPNRLFVRFLCFGCAIR